MTTWTCQQILKDGLKQSKSSGALKTVQEANATNVSRQKFTGLLNTVQIL